MSTPESASAKGGPSTEQDVKPKLTVTVVFESEAIQVRVKANTLLSKIFEAAEKRFRKDPGTLKFVIEGQRLQPTSTPAESGIEDGDTIDAFLGQTGGCLGLP